MSLGAICRVKGGSWVARFQTSAWPGTSSVAATAGAGCRIASQYLRMVSFGAFPKAMTVSTLSSTDCSIRSGWTVT